MSVQGTTDCPPLALAVVSGLDSTLAFLQPIALPGVKNNVRLAGAALGEWDAVPGIDLLANVFETCLSASDAVRAASPGRHPAERWGRRRGPRDLSAGDGHRGPWGSKPLVLDVDDDGRNEAVIATETGLRIIDPSDDWRSVPIPGPRAVPLAARSDGGPVRNGR